jgi:rod shape-determining protein MreD
MRAPALKEFMPACSVALATLLAALPWGLPSEARFLLPLLPYTAIHFWAVRRPALMPEWLVFLAGLTTDVLTNGPLGYWSLVFLLGYILVLPLLPLTRYGALGRWLHFAITLLLLALAQWLIASIFFMQGIDWRPLLRAAVVACMLYPLAGFLFRPLNRLWIRPDNTALGRGA